MKPMNEKDLDIVSGGVSLPNEPAATFTPAPEMVICTKYVCPSCKKQNLSLNSQDATHYYIHCNDCGADFTVFK